MISDEIRYEESVIVGDSIRNEDAIHAGDQCVVISVHILPCQPFKVSGREIVIDNTGRRLVF